MAAYATLVSLMDLIEQIQHHQPDPPLSLDPKQAKSLTEKISFLQGFLEDFHSRGLSQEIQALESRITDATHAAEDAIESKVLLASGSTEEEDVIGNKTYSTDLYEGLQRVIHDMEFIEKEAMDTKNKKLRVEEDDHQQIPRSSLLPPPLGSSLIENTTTMVGFNDVCIKIMDRLTRNQSRREIVPLVGMGGSGKTTLARNIYERKLIAEHFHRRSWATISQECVVREILIDFLLCLSNQKSREELSRESEDDLGEQLYKSLFDRKYLIVMDDVWSIEAWNKLKFFFPDNNNGSKIMITTRLSKLAFDLTGSHSHVVKMYPLDEDTSWDLLRMKLFADKSCPLELEELGRTIARNCRGLPLSIVTTGGLLAKSGMTREYWKYVAENLSSLVNSEDNDRCLRILSLSYINLPVHLKPCFLYMGLFPEDEMIKASYLIRLWVAEGFLKPASGKTLEVVGEDYLKDLVERNLVSVHKWGFTGKIRSCSVHDLLRDLCLREAQKERFFYVGRIDNLQDNGISKTQRRIAIHRDTPHCGTPYSAPFLRSCIIGSENVLKLISLRSVRLLRILAGIQSNMDYGIDDIVPLVNSRFLSLKETSLTIFKDISFFWSMSWNLQTLVINASLKGLDIWNMPQLRHVKIESIYMSDPLPSSNVDVGRLLVLENLQTLSKVRNFKYGEEVVKRIPSLKKLSISFSESKVEGKTSSMDYYCLDNLGRLKNLESLTINIHLDKSWWNWGNGLTLPYSLKKLTLWSIHLDNDVMNLMVGGSLPLLEVLKLKFVAFKGDEWNPIEGQFCRLKYLELNSFKSLKYWNADNNHFPRLEHLKIVGKPSLEEFPSGIGDIPTLRLIELHHVRDSVLISAKRMLEEQEEQLGNVTLLIHVTSFYIQKKLAKSLANNNFKIIE